VTVTAKSLVAEEFQYMEINKIDIYTNPAAQADPLLAVNSLPSATTTDESANISLRGSSPVETGIFLNNVPVYDAVRYAQLNGIGTFSIFNTAIIEDVTVFPGNPPLEFGNVTSGVIAIDTDQRILEGSANSLIVSLASVSFSREQRISDNQSIKIFTNWQPSAAIKKVNAKALEDINSFSSNDLGIYWYGSSSRLNWKVFSYTNIEGFEFNFQHPSFVGSFNQSKKRSFLTSTVTFPLAKGAISINNGLSKSRGDFSYSNVSFQVDNHDIFGGINYQVDTEKISFKTGFSYDYRFSEVDGNFHRFGFALDTDHPTDELNEQVEVITPESFAYLKYYLLQDLALGFGLRKNIPRDSIDYLSGQMNLAYTFGDWSATFGVGRYNKSGLFENSGSPFVSESDQFSLDLNYSKKNLNAALSVFEKASKINEQKYETRGIELFSSYQLTDKFTASGSLTWLDASSKADESFEYDLSYFLRANISYQPGKFWTFESILNSRQGTLYDPVASASFNTDFEVFEPVFEETPLRLPNYWNVGLSVSKIFFAKEEASFIAFMSINNLFNNNNVRALNYSEDYSRSEQSLFSQRTGYVGVVINF
ncbi:MAG: TonB-dependent receptor plug domain-containing protein, partial [Bacteroidota bacterium]